MVAKIVRFGQSTFASLTKRNFRLYFIGQTISQTGGWMQGVAQSWLVLHLTGSAAALGIVSALQFAPVLFFGPYAGVLADRFSKRRLLYVTQTVLGLLALALGLAVMTGTVRTWMVYAVAGVLGLVNAVDYPTRQSFLYELSGPTEVVSAVGLAGTATNLARVVGPALAGVLIASTGLAVCFLLNAVSFVAVLVCLGMMRAADFHRSVPKTSDTNIAEGFAYAMRTPVVRESLLMMAIVGVFTYEFNVTLPALAKFTLHGDAAALASLMSAMGVGAAVGGLVTAGRRGDGLGRLTLTGLAFGAFTGLVGLAPNLAVATGIMFFVGMFAARFTGLSNGILQLRSDPVYRNRVVALWSTAFMGSAFVGAPLIGWIAETLDPRFGLATGAIGGVIAAAVGVAGLRRHASDTSAQAIWRAFRSERDHAA